MLKSYFIDQLIPLDDIDSPVDAIAGRFLLPDTYIASYIAIPSTPQSSAGGIWITVFQDPQRTRFELGTLAALYLSIIAARFGSALKRHGLILHAEDGPIGGIDIGDENDRIWVCQIGVSKTKSGFSMRVPGKSSVPLAELCVDTMQTYISDIDSIKGAAS